MANRFTLNDFLAEGKRVLGLAEKAATVDVAAELRDEIMVLKASFESEKALVVAETLTNIALRADAEKLNAEIADAKAKLATFDSEVEKVSAMKAAQIVASQGVPPLKIGADNGAETPTSTATGLARVAEAFKRQNQKN